MALIYARRTAKPGARNLSAHPGTRPKSLDAGCPRHIGRARDQEKPTMDQHEDRKTGADFIGGTGR
jgi:hypothetical protein